MKQLISQQMTNIKSVKILKTVLYTILVLAIGTIGFFTTTENFALYSRFITAVCFFVMMLCVIKLYNIGAVH